MDGLISIEVGPPRVLCQNPSEAVTVLSWLELPAIASIRSPLPSMAYKSTVQVSCGVSTRLIPTTFQAMPEKLLSVHGVPTQSVSAPSQVPEQLASSVMLHDVLMQQAPVGSGRQISPSHGTPSPWYSPPTFAHWLSATDAHDPLLRQQAPIARLQGESVQLVPSPWKTPPRLSHSMSA